MHYELFMTVKFLRFRNACDKECDQHVLYIDRNKQNTTELKKKNHKKAKTTTVENKNQKPNWCIITTSLVRQWAN